jgi:hypothetical protein
VEVEEEKVDWGQTTIYRHGFEYDEVGSTLYKRDLTTSPPTVLASLTYNAADQITNTGFSYDTNGNMTAEVRPETSETWTYTFDSQNRMTAASDGTNDYSYDYDGDGPIRLAGRDYAKGIMLHPEVTDEGGIGHVTYALDGGLREARLFCAVVGIDETEGPAGSVTFIVEVYRDGEWRRVFESGVLKGGETEEVSIDIAGAERIRLVTTDAGDNIYSDCAVWADAKLQ